MRVDSLSLWAALLASCASTQPAKQAQDTQAIDDRHIATFAGHGDISDVKISTNGTYLAAVSNASGETRLAFFKVADLTSTGGFRMAGSDIITHLEWINDERVVAELAHTGGPLEIPQRYGEIFAVNFNGANPRMVFGYRSGGTETGSHIQYAEQLRAWGFIVDRIAAKPERVLIQSNTWPIADSAIDRSIYEAYEVDAYNGKRYRVASGPGVVDAYFSDEQGTLRLALTSNTDSMYEAYWLEGEQWKRLDKIAPFRAGSIPVGFSASKRELYVVEEEYAGRPKLFAASLDSGARSVLAEEPGVSPGQIVLDPLDGSPVAVEFELDYPKWTLIDPARKPAQLIQLALAAFPGRHVRMMNMTADAQTAVVLVYSDREPGAYCLVNAADKTVRPLFTVRDKIDPNLISGVEAFKIRASDGLTLHGYLTLPKASSQGPLPMIVIPHGGPQARDYWRFDPEAQLFASNGYAVLQLNFRGSEGYGPTFTAAGYQHWGDRIQDDLIEATRWAIHEKVADPRRVCIFGGSFGGYSAVQTSIRAPDIFRCAIGYDGIYDLALMFEEGDIPLSTRGRAYLKRVLGDDQEALRKASPTYNVDQIRVPILLIHGEKDERAPIEHAKKLCEALKEHQQVCETFFAAHEQHGFWDDENRREMYKRVLDFVAKNTK